MAKKPSPKKSRTLRLQLDVMLGNAEVVMRVIAEATAAGPPPEF
jgi:hypothetical protein